MLVEELGIDITRYCNVSKTFIGTDVSNGSYIRIQEFHLAKLGITPDTLLEYNNMIESYKKDDISYNLQDIIPHTASVPEKIFGVILELNKINFLYQYSVDIEGSKRRFDFKIADTLVEIHGSQHYSGGRTERNKLMHFNAVLSDTMKRLYCDNHGIELIEVNARWSTCNCIMTSLKETSLSYLLENITKKEIKSRLIEVYELYL